MDAPVGVHEEEAGDAELLFPPHHPASIPACAALGNRPLKKSDAANETAPWEISRYVDSRAWSTLLCRRCVARSNHDCPHKTWIARLDPCRTGRLVLSGLGRVRLPFASPEGVSRGDLPRGIF